MPSPFVGLSAFNNQPSKPSETLALFLRPSPVGWRAEDGLRNRAGHLAVRNSHSTRAADLIRSFLGAGAPGRFRQGFGRGEACPRLRFLAGETGPEWLAHRCAVSRSGSVSQGGDARWSPCLQSL